MRGATCFSGIGAPEVAMPDVEWIWHSDIEPFPCAVIAERHPSNQNLGDILAPDFIDRAKAMGPLDIMVGGPPCQAFSIAGLRGSMSDPRGNLSLRWVQVLHAIRPSIAITENVPGWLNTADNAFGCFLAGVVGADAPLVSPAEQGRWPNHGMVAGPLARAAWRILNAQYCRTREFPWAVPQRRRRVFVVVDFGAGIVDPAAVLFDRESLLGNPAPRREAGERPAPTLAARTRGGGGLGTDFDLDGGQTPICEDDWPIAFPAEMSSTQAASTENLSTALSVKHTTAIAFNAKDHGGDAQNEVSPTLRAGGHTGGHANAGAMPAVAFKPGSSADARSIGAQEEVACTLEAGGGGNNRQAVAIQDIRGIDKAQNGKGWSESETSYTVDTKATQGVAQDWQVRRLTPRECERLQGFPDDFTLIPWRGKPAEECPDGPRYKALGNSMAVNVIQWIWHRIKESKA